MGWWPGWNTIEGADWWHDFFWWVGIACLAGLVVSEVVAKRYSTRKDELVAIDQQQKDEESETRRKTEVESLQKRLSEAGKQVAELERLNTPRHLIAEQKTKLSAFLRASLKGKMTIFASASVSDATDYANEIAKVFAETGWQIPPVLTSLFVGGDVTGTWITVRGPDVPQAAQIVFEALKAANIQIRDQAMGDDSPNGPAPDEVWLKIGTPK